MFTDSDLRHAWNTFTSRGGPPSPDEERTLQALPAGARAIPLDWVFNVESEQRGHFDRDSGSEVEITLTHIRGWREHADPRTTHGGALQLSQVDSIANGLLSSWPPRDALPSVRALSMNARDLTPLAIQVLGERARIEDIDTWRCWEWRDTLATVCSALATHMKGLRGLSLHNVEWTAEAARALAGASFFPQVDDLQLSFSVLGDECGALLADAAGSLAHLDLSSGGLSGATIAKWAPHLVGARSILLPGNPMGRAGLRALMDAGAFSRVEELRLFDCGLDDDDVEMLVKFPMPRLRGLMLHGNRITDRSVDAVARSALLSQLHGLSLFGGAVSGPGALAGHPLEDAWLGTARLSGKLAYWFMGRPGQGSTLQ